MSRAEGPTTAGRRPSLAAAIVLIALPCLFFAPVLFGGQVLLPATYLAHFDPWREVLPQQPHVYWNALVWDAMAQYLPWRAFAHRWLAQGVIPLWNPHQFCGTPFVANGQSALFYPLNLVFWLMEPARAFGWAMALHFVLAGLFAFAFLRTLGLGRFGALLGGAAFQFCGFFVTWAELPTLVNVGIWLPLALLCIERFFQSHRMRWAIAGGAVLGVALLAGHPQMAIYLLLGAGAYFIYRWGCELWDGGRAAIVAGLAGGAAAVGIAFALAAVQVLPIAEIIPYSHRAGGGGGYAGFLKFAVPWRHLVTIALPDFFGRPTEGTYWDWPAGNYAELVTYVGIAPLLLAALAVAWRRWSRCPRHVWFFVVGAVVALAVALGAPLNYLFVRLIPGFAGPGRMLYLWAAFAALLAGVGADALVHRLRSDDRRALARDGLIAAGALVVAAAALGFAAWVSLPHDRRPPAGLLLDLAGPGMVVLVVVGLIWAALMIAAARRWVGAAFVGTMLVALTVGDLFAFGIGYNPTSPRRYVYPETPQIRLLKQVGPDARCLGLRQTWPIGPEFPRAALPPNAATYYGLYDVNGYDSIYLQGYKNALAAAIGRDPSPPANGNMVFADALTPEATWSYGIRYVLDAGPEGSRVRHVSDEARRASVTTVYTLADIAHFQTWPARVAVVSPNAFELSWRPPVSCPGGWLALRDAPFPGWRALKGGRPVKLGSVRHSSLLMSQTAVRSDDPPLTFRYEPTTFRFGLFVTLCALGLLAGTAGMLAWHRWRRQTALPLDGGG